MTTTLVASASAQSLPPGWTISNIGNPTIGGSASFNSGIYSVSGAGTDVGGSADQFTFVHRQVSSDTTFVARVDSLQSVSGWSKAGVMIRESLAANSKNAFAFVTPSRGMTFQRRTTTGGSSSSTNGGSGTAPVWLKLERRTNTVTAYRSADGATWSSIGSATVSMTSTVYVGLAVTSRDATRTATSTFTNVSEPVPPGWTATDLGAPAITGSTQYASGTFTVEGAGVDVWDVSDEFRYVYQPFSGDIEITSRVVSLENTDEWAKAGVMIRETLADNAVQTSLVVTPAHGTNFYRRLTTGAVTQPGPVGAVGAPYWVRLVRQGSTVTGLQSSDGVTWTTVGTTTMATATMYVGLEVTSHDPAQAATAVFDNVTVRVPSATNQAPTVSLTAPANGATYTAPATITVTATAGDADGTVSSVSFYAGSTLIGTDTTEPYSVTWSGAAAGGYQLTAVARDDDAATTTSAARSVTVSTASNQPPVVSLTAPASGSTFSAPATITISANASDTDGTVASVEFYVGMMLLGTDTSSPYSATWSNASAGTYWLTARARDNAGVITTSASRSVTVTGGLPTGWTATDIGAPAITGSTQYGSGTFTVEGAGVDVWDTSDQYRYVYQAFSGDIEITSRVVSLENTDEWAKAGVMIRETLAANAVQTSLVVTPAHGTNFYRRLATGAVTQPGPVGTVGAPYWVRLVRQGNTVTGLQSSDGVTWTAVGTATMATATMYVGLEVTSHNPAQAATAVFDSVTVRVPPPNTAPTTTLTGPANGATYTAPATITVTATASDTDGTVSSVSFYAGTALIGTDTSSPYSVNWSNVAAGSYSLTAVARDNSGAATTSTARSVTVSPGNSPPLVSLTAPAAGAIYTAPATVALTATASDADGTIVSVDFYAGSTLIGSDTTSPYGVSWNNVAAGSYAITAAARDNLGAMTVSGTRDIRVDPAAMPRTAIFTASTNHASAVDRYFLEIFPAGANPLVANPVATRDLGKPPVVGGEISVDVGATTSALPAGSYIATVTAIGSGGSARSAASPTFVR